MRAFTLDSFESPPGLRDDLPTLTAGANEVLVRVHASSVNPADAEGSLVNRRVTTAAATVVAAVIIGLNLFLLQQTLIG